MKRRSGPPRLPPPVFHAPMRFEWTEEKLKLLSQEQLLNLLGNLDHQIAIGRLQSEEAERLGPLITSLLTKPNGRKRRKQLAHAAALEADSPGPA